MANYLYLIVNKINYKLYFGSHCWNGDGVDPYYYGSGIAIKQAFKKYGKENFIIKPIAFYDTAEECRKAEDELLTRLDVANNSRCYNMKNSAFGWDKGRPLSAETKRKMSESQKGRVVTEEHRRKISESKKGRKLSEEHRQKLSESRKGLKHSEDTKRKISESTKGLLKGIPKTLETKLKMSQAKADKKIPIVAIGLSTGRVELFTSQSECSRILGLYTSNVVACVRGRRKSAGGYTFKSINRDRRVFTVSQSSKSDLNRLRGIA